LVKEDKPKLATETSPDVDTPNTGASGGQPPQAPARQQVELDDSHATSCYANFCRVTATPEEVILDLGLNAHPFGTPAGKVAVSQRLIMNFFTAKRLLAALSMTVQRHEQMFGVLETDVNKRVQPSARQ
jgi:hypothetical protein